MTFVAPFGFRVPTYGLAPDFRLETKQNAISLAGDSPRKSTTEPQLGIHKSETLTKYLIYPDIHID